MRRMFDYVMYAVALVAPFALFPQVLQVFEYKNASSLSLLTWVLLGAGSFLWCMYGLMHHDRPIFITNLFLSILDFIIVFGIFLYR